MVVVVSRESKQACFRCLPGVGAVPSTKQYCSGFLASVHVIPFLRPLVLQQPPRPTVPAALPLQGWVSACAFLRGHRPPPKPACLPEEGRERARERGGEVKG